MMEASTEHLLPPSSLFEPPLPPHPTPNPTLHAPHSAHTPNQPQEAERVMETFTQHLHLPVMLVDDSAKMLQKLKGLTDPEAKRKCIGGHFIEVGGRGGGIALGGGREGADGGTE